MPSMRPRSGSGPARTVTSRARHCRRPNRRHGRLDYPRLLAQLKLDRPGVILFRGGSYSDTEMLALLDRVLAQAETLELDRSITVVDQHRIRRRGLPLSADRPYPKASTGRQPQQLRPRVACRARDGRRPYGLCLRRLLGKTSAIRAAFLKGEFVASPRSQGRTLSWGPLPRDFVRTDIGKAPRERGRRPARGRQEGRGALRRGAASGRCESTDRPASASPSHRSPSAA
jgi:hypothetical protein